MSFDVRSGPFSLLCTRGSGFGLPVQNAVLQSQHHSICILNYCCFYSKATPVICVTVWEAVAWLLQERQQLSKPCHQSWQGVSSHQGQSVPLARSSARATWHQLSQWQVQLAFLHQFHSLINEHAFEAEHLSVENINKQRNNNNNNHIDE